MRENFMVQKMWSQYYKMKMIRKIISGMGSVESMEFFVDKML
jgi:transcription termination factor Rho